MRGDRWFVLSCVLLLLASSAAAQSRPIVTQDKFLAPFEIGAGFTIQAPADVNQSPLCVRLSLPCTSPRTMPDPGIALMPVANLTSSFAIVGEVSAFRNAWISFSTDCPPVGQHRPSECPATAINHVRSALVGVRTRTSLIETGDRFRLFAQVMMGEQWSSVTPPRRALQPGVGADDYLRNGLTLHVAYDYCWVPGATRDLSTGRFLVGLTFLLGDD